MVEISKAKTDQYVQDKTATMFVLADLIRNPMLFLDDNYHLTIEDFPTRFHCIVFAALEHLIKDGATSITPITIDEYLSRYPEQYKIFSGNNGPEYVAKLVELAPEGNFEHYYKRLKKITLLNKLHQSGIDITEYYDPSAIGIETASKTQERFDNATIDDIMQFYELKLAAVKDAVGATSGRIGIQAAEGMARLKESLKEKPEMGAPMNSKKMATICRGRRLTKLYLRVAPSGIGKAVTNNTIIPTYNKGMMRVGDIRPGDLLIGRDGKPTRVLAIHPQAEKKQVYEVHFYDGRVAECCKDHLWFYYYDRHNPNLSRVETTEQILNRYSGRWREGAKGAYKVRIPLCLPAEHPEKEFLIPPYIMGLFLGDGSFRVSERNKTFYYSSEDCVLPQFIADTMGWEVFKNGGKNYSYVFKKDGKGIHVQDVVTQYPELFNLYSHEKFIPEDYLQASVQQRIALLRGLLDTDGHINSFDKGSITFSTSSARMTECLTSLCYSLGLTASVITDKREKYRTGVCYGVHIQCPRDLKPSLFSLPRKKAIAEEYATSTRRNCYKDYNAIVDIIPTDRYEDMTCFTVDAPDALFLINDCIVTHNTRLSLADACLVSIPRRYNPVLKKWVKTNCQEPTLFITTELEKEEVQTMIIAYIACVPEEHILDGKYDPGEEKRVDRAISIIEKAPLWIEHFPQFNIDDIENLIKEHKLRHNISFVMFDYIFTSTKVLMEMAQKTRGVSIREDNVLMLFSDRMKSLCNKLNIHIDTSTQANGDWKNTKDPDQNLIRGSKAIADKVDIGYVVLPPTPKDLEVVQSIMAGGGTPFYQPPNLIYHVFKVRRGKLNHVKLFLYFDYSTLRTTDLFVTDKDYNLLDVENTDIETLLDETEEEEEKKAQTKPFII